MDKITEIRLNDIVGQVKFVGQLIFKQIMNLTVKVDINGLIRNHERLLLQIIQDHNTPFHS
jgi:hypothetical protein